MLIIASSPLLSLLPPPSPPTSALSFEILKENERFHLRTGRNICLLGFAAVVVEMTALINCNSWS